MINIKGVDYALFLAVSESRKFNITTVGNVASLSKYVFHIGNYVLSYVGYTREGGLLPRSKVI